MKKIGYALLILLSTIALVSCKSKVDFKPIISELSEIYSEGDTKDNIKNNLNLKTELKGYEGLEVKWSSNNQDVLTNEGVVNRTDEDVKVELKLEVKYKKEVKVEIFNLTVIKKEKEVVEDIFYNVVFLVDNIEYKNESIKENTRLSEPTKPVKKGFVFIGWYENDEKYNFDNLVNGDIILTAKFEKELENKTVSFIVDNKEYKKVEVLEGNKVTKPENPKKVGYTFVGWYLDDNEFNFDTEIKTNLTIIAKFVINTYEVIFKVDNNIYLTNEVMHNSLVEVPKTPTKVGYKFVKWNLNGIEYNFNAKVTKNLLLEAEFELIETTKPKDPTINIGGVEVKVNDIKNDDVTNLDTNGNILFPKDEPIKIYDKQGYETIVKNWKNPFPNNTIFAVVENGLIVETYERKERKTMNAQSTTPISTTSNITSATYWKELNVSENGYVVIAQNQVDYNTKEPIHDATYFNELANAGYNSKYNRLTIGEGQTSNLPTKVIRNGKVIKDHLGNEVLLPVYKEQDEVRAVWISTVWNMDLAQYKNEQQYKNEIIKTLNHIESLKFNTVFFQVRPMNDAFYPSELAPYSRFINGKEGFDPGFDILRFVIDEAHKRDLELHAWLNPYRVATSQGGFDTITKDNFAAKNPELVISQNNSYILDPGQAKVQKYIKDVIEEIITNYKDIDGIHFDDYFYLTTFGENSNSPDYQTYLNNRLPNESIADFRRRSVNNAIKGVFELIDDFNKTNNKSVKFGVAPTGIWKNGGAGSATAGQQHYHSLYADSKKWIDEGWIHYIMPQLYWPFDKFGSQGNPVAPFANLVQWWNDAVRGTDVAFIVGQGFYRLDPAASGHDWFYDDELVEQLRYIQQFSGVNGVSIFTYNTFNSNVPAIQNSINDLTSNYWTKKVSPRW